VLIATMSNRALGPGLVRAVIGDNGALVHEERMLTEIGTRMRDVVQAPDGIVAGHSHAEMAHEVNGVAITSGCGAQTR
jgi:hypothetical protein